MRIDVCGLMTCCPGRDIASLPQSWWTGNRAQNGNPLTKRLDSMATSEIKSSSPLRQRPSANAMVENVLKCKWSLTVLQLVRRGTRRPGAMEHAVPGLTAKVLNERLRKLVRYGVFSRKVFPEIPPRVEYSLTA